ncbi:MAG: hypothetical protein GXO55_11225 [Chloroflexi bacterium]|nr:hypothetical protein [Chloroflexota bacterium]
MIDVTWPGLVLVLLFGTAMGAGVAFWKARTVREVGWFILLGVLGFLVGQLLATLAPIRLFRIGVVQLEYGILGAIIFLFIGIRKRPKR